MRIGRWALPLLVGTALPACSATHVVRPLPRGGSQLSLSAGGPYLPGQMPTAVTPYVTLGMQRGVSDALTVGATVHATMAAYRVAGVDLSATRGLLGHAESPLALAGTATLYAFAGPGGARLLPAVGAVASWRPGSRTLVYGGGTALAQFRGTPRVLLTPLAGVQQRVRQRLGLQAEAKWMAANAVTRAGVFEGNSSLGGRGALAVQLGVVLQRRPPGGGR